jgi:HAE1 family hydrophobic/amphiphilic exporter-1
MLPLVFATGAGANGSRTIGVGTVGGMLLGTLALLLFTPALFVIFQALQERFKSVTFSVPADPMIREELRRIEENRKKKQER